METTDRIPAAAEEAAGPPRLARPYQSGAGAEALAPKTPGVTRGPPGEIPEEQLVDALARLAPCGRERPLGEHGFVRLVDAMPRLVEAGGLGPEAAVVQAARISYGAGTKTAQSDEVLLRYLFRLEHLTPFEMVVLKFSVRAPLFTARQWMRHRAGSYNELSARYSSLSTEFYIPAEAEVLAQSAANKQGAGDSLPAEVAGQVRREMKRGQTYSAAVYEDFLEKGVAREMARIVLPEGRYTSFYWTVNLRNLFHFLGLRLAPAAQENIRSYAGAILEILRGYCPLAVRAFEDYALGAMTLTAAEIRALRERTVDLRAAPQHNSDPAEAETEMTVRERAEWARKRGRLGLP